MQRAPLYLSSSPFSFYETHKLENNRKGKKESRPDVEVNK